MNVLGLGWIGLVSDRPEMRHFYSDALGLEVLEAESGFSYYRVGETTRLEILASHTATAARQRADAPALGFLVDDLEGAIHKLRQAGVSLTSEVKEWRSGDAVHRWIYLTDPDNNILLLLERRGE